VGLADELVARFAVGVLEEDVGGRLLLFLEPLVGQRVFLRERSLPAAG